MSKSLPPPIELQELLGKTSLGDEIKKEVTSITFEGRSETPEERVSRLRQDEWKTKVKLFKEIAVSLAALLGGGIIIFIAVDIIRNPSASADDKKWATSIIASVVSGLIGYLTGKASQ